MIYQGLSSHAIFKLQTLANFEFRDDCFLMIQAYLDNKFLVTSVKR